ncbi:GGDEF domain-containing protein [Haliovirga abyssi]|uniref:GGDEF domain-containing protein n=1 Tax=Haliovirga abyssi TaxID=2996794 RepID=A0AAU9DF32_9FUSO|nr:GGDEF domain-containing protein [Haliovirga abyssi]BDU49972.1 hypothetical protein HLVA_05410 [Haliovirga abyssi]
MFNKISQKLILLALGPVIFFSLILFVLINFIFVNTIEKNFKQKLNDSSIYVNQTINGIIERETSKVSILARETELNILIKEGYKKTGIPYKIYKTKNGVPYVKFKKVKTKFDYLVSLTYWKEAMYNQANNRYRGLELFNEDGKIIGRSSGKKKMLKTKDYDNMVMAVLNKNTVFKRKKIVSRIEVNEGLLYLKIFVPVPTDSNNPYGGIILSYPLDRDALLEIKGKTESELKFLDEDFNSKYSTILFKSNNEILNYKDYKELIKKGIPFKIKNRGEYAIAIPFTNVKDKNIGYILIIKRIKELQELEDKFQNIIIIVSIILIILISFVILLEAHKIIEQINKLVLGIENIENEEYEVIEDGEFDIYEFELLRKKYNAMILNLKRNIEGINYRDEALTRMNEELMMVIKEKEKAYKMSIRDGLTKLYNHKYFQEKLLEEIKKSKRYGASLSLIMLDIDYFKKFNDDYGHQVGDKVLINLSKVLRDTIREYDIAARYGGEEFMVILPNTDQIGVRVLAERVRQVVEKTKVENLKVTISLGITTFPVGCKEIKENEDPVKIRDIMIKQVDEALYKSKEKGRNRVTEYIGGES